MADLRLDEPRNSSEVLEDALSIRLREKKNLIFLFELADVDGDYEAFDRLVCWPSNLCLNRPYHTKRLIYKIVFLDQMLPQN
jgi:hypothetical protein